MNEHHGRRMNEHVFIVLAATLEKNDKALDIEVKVGGLFGVNVLFGERDDLVDNTMCCAFQHLDYQHSQCKFTPTLPSSGTSRTAVTTS